MNPEERNRLRQFKRKQIGSSDLQPQQVLETPPEPADPEKRPDELEEPTVGHSEQPETPQPKRARESIDEERCYYKPDWTISPTDSALGDATVSAQLCNEILLPADFDLITDKFPTFEAHVAGARTRCFEALTFVTALEQRMDVWLLEMVKLRKMLNNAQDEAQRSKDETENLSRTLDELKQANLSLEESLKQKSAGLEAAQKELEEVKMGIPSQMKEAGARAVEDFKNSEEFWDVVDSRSLKYYEGALHDVRTRMAVHYPEIDASFLENILEDEAETLAAAVHGASSEEKVVKVGSGSGEADQDGADQSRGN